MKKSYGIVLFILSLVFICSSWVLAADEYTLEKIKVVGNEKVKEEVILQLLPFNVGDQFTKAEMKEQATLATRILKEERLFFNVNVFPFFSSTTKTCKVLVEITGEWTYQFGFGVMPFYLMVEDLAFLGNHATLGTELSLSRQKIYYVNRTAFNQPFDLKFNLYNQNKIVGRIYDYDEKYYAHKGYGGAVGLTHELTEKQSLALSFGLDHKRFGTNLEDAVLDEELGFYNHDLFSVKTQYSFNSDIHGFGSTTMLKVNKVLGRDVKYLQGVTDLRYFKNLFGNLQGAVKLQYGITSVNTPYHELFNLNHLNGVRGYQEMTPGIQEVLLKTELIHPLAYGVQGVVFFDAGNTWNSTDEFAMDDVGMGYGLGLRYRAGMPINTTFRIEVAFSEHGVGTYFVVGESF